MAKKPQTAAPGPAAPAVQPGFRRLIVCADGTWNTPEQQNNNQPAPTNVTKMKRAVQSMDSKGVTQMTYYHPGVGTGGPFDKLIGGVTGQGIDQNILDCYDFLVSNYLEGDELYLFGFSRGAYTVRSLAGLIRNSGLLRGDFLSMQSEAFSLYRDRDPSKAPNGAAAIQFRKSFSYDVDITCIGVWDTVGALGIPLDLFKGIDAALYSFHDVGLSSHVRNAFHAISIDESRASFVPTLWEQDPTDTNWLEQCWFAGVHSNVGGGYSDSGLSDVAFMWMVGRLKAKCPQLEFDDQYLGTIVPAPLGKLYDSLQGFEALGTEVREIDDAKWSQRVPGKLTREFVHPSVPARVDGTKDGHSVYDPQNFATYASRTDPVPVFVDSLDPPT